MFNDLWQYNIVEKSWLHLKGSKSKDDNSNYNTPLPGGINKHKMIVYDMFIYVFGGEGYDNTDPGN